MITCKCGCIYPDEYAGSCGDCGAGMGSQSGQAQPRVWSAPMAAQRQPETAGQTRNMNFDRNDPVFMTAQEIALDLCTPKEPDGA